MVTQLDVSLFVADGEERVALFYNQERLSLLSPLAVFTRERVLASSHTDWLDGKNS